MSDKLVKEIITTTTERFGDNGNVKEKITESREKIYSVAYTEEEISKAEVVKEEGEKPSPKPASKSQEDKIKDAAAAIDAQAKNPIIEQAKAATPNPFENMPKPTQENPFLAWQQQQAQKPVDVPQYNVANRVPNPTKFPWEDK